MYSSSSSLYAQTDQARENDLKAYFVYIIVKYVEWENIDKNSDFVIGVIGDHYLLAPFVKISRTEKIKNKNFTVKQVTLNDDLNNCRILFIAGSENNNLTTILEKTRTQNVLTIGDKAGFAEKGVNVNILTYSG